MVFKPVVKDGCQCQDAERDIALELAVPLIDLAQSFPKNNDLWEPDGIHMVAAGTYEQASQYAAFLDASGLILRREHAALP